MYTALTPQGSKAVVYLYLISHGNLANCEVKWRKYSNGPTKKTQMLEKKNTKKTPNITEIAKLLSSASLPYKNTRMFCKDNNSRGFVNMCFWIEMKLLFDLIEYISLKQLNWWSTNGFSKLCYCYSINWQRFNAVVINTFSEISSFSLYSISHRDTLKMKVQSQSFSRWVLWKFDVTLKP